MQQNYILLISTRSQEEGLCAIVDPTGNSIHREKLRFDLNTDLEQKLLPTLSSLLSRAHLSPADISGILFDSGQGRFTSLRLGATVANVLGWVLGKHVAPVALENDIDISSVQVREVIRRGVDILQRSHVFEPILPVYGSEPTITLRT